MPVLVTRIRVNIFKPGKGLKASFEGGGGNMKVTVTNVRDSDTWVVIYLNGRESTNYQTQYKRKPIPQIAMTI